MSESKIYLGYTIISKRTDGKLMFLVNQEQEDFIFPTTCHEETYTGLAAIIDVIKETLNLKMNQLELIELTNAVVKERHLPLFVFDYDNHATEVSELLLPDSKLEWRPSDDLTDTLKEFEIAGAPYF